MCESRIYEDANPHLQVAKLTRSSRRYNKIIFATGASSVIFFLLGVFIGAFFIFNLVLAVVAVK